MNKTLKLYFTSDLHGYLLPTDFMTNEPRPMGLARMAPEIRKDGNTLVIDGGDTIQGSPLTYFCRKEGIAPPIAACMNRVGYDYVALGNHDFNYGRETLQTYLEGLDAQCLCANIADSRGKLPVQPSAVRVLENGLRVGLIGVTTSFIPRWERPEHLEGITFTDALAAAQAEADRLRGEVDILIGIYHGGFEKELATGRILSETDENIACALCEALPLDILLTGHQHIALENTVYHGVHVVQTPANGRAYIALEATLGEAGLAVHSTLKTPEAEPDATIMRLLEPINTPLQAWLDQPAGHLPYDLLPEEKAIMGAKGSPIADFFNQVQLAETGAQVSCVSLANDVKGLAEYATVRDVVSTYVYPNTLLTLRVSGAILRAALERAASYLEVGPDGAVHVSRLFLEPKIEHYNYDFYLGIGYTFDLRRPIGQRVVRMEYEGVPIAEVQELTLCLNNYRATGAGGYEMLQECPRIREGTKEISEMILDYLAEHDPVEIQRADFKTVW